MIVQQQTLFDLSVYEREPDPMPADMLSEYLGPEDAAAITERLAGLTVFVPVYTHGPEYDFIVKQIGLELAERMRHIFGGEVLYISKNRQRQLSERRLEILKRFRELRNTGERRTVAIRMIASEMGLSDRHVKRLIQ